MTQRSSTALPLKERDFFLGGTSVDERTGYLLMAANLVTGSPEVGFNWTSNGAEWLSNLLAGAAEDRIKETA